MARRRKSKTTIDLQRTWKVKGTKKGGDAGMEVRAGPLKIQLDEETILRPLGEDMVKRLVEVTEETRAKPKKSTIKRRGPGDLFDVTGKFKRSIRYEIKRGDLFIETDRFSPGVRGHYLRRIKPARPVEVKRWLVRTGRLEKLMRTEVIQSAFNTRPGIPPKRIGGLVRRKK